MKKYAVKAADIEDFCNQYHSRRAYHDRGREYMDYDLQSHIKEFKEFRYTTIPASSSTTGDTVTYYGDNL